MLRRLLSLVLPVATISAAAYLLAPDTLIARNTDMDAGVYLMVARLLHRGCQVHKIFFDQFWFFPQILATAFDIFGDSLIVGRLTVFAFSMAGIFGLGVLMRQLSGKWTLACAAMFLCALSPLYIRESRMAMADVPSIACILWALVWAVRFQTDRERVWLALSAICASASILLKPFTVGFVVTIILIVVATRWRSETARGEFMSAIFGDFLIFAVAGALTAAPFVDFIHPIDEYQRTVGFHFAEKAWFIKRVDDRWRGLFEFARFNLPIVAFGIAGLVAMRPLPFFPKALLVGELITTALLLAMPPWLHHYVLILPGLIMLAVLGIPSEWQKVCAWKHALRAKALRNLQSKFASVVFAVALLAGAIDLPWLVRFSLHARWPRLIETEPIVQYIEQTSRPNEYLISDDALIVYLAGRVIPPEAIDFTFADVLKFQPETLPRFEEIFRDEKITEMIVTSRFDRNRNLMRWLQSHFAKSTMVGSDHKNQLPARVFSEPNAGS